MGVATGFTAARMLEIEQTTVVAGSVDGSGNLTLVRRNGSTIAAGNVKGPKGDNAVYSIPGFPNSASGTYVRLGTMDGLNDVNGAHMEFTLSGIGSFGALKRGTVIVHAVQRGVDLVDLRAWGFGFEELPASALKLYTRKMGTYLYEVWAQFAAWTAKPTYFEQSSWRSTIQLDSNTTTAPSNLVEWSITKVHAPAATTDEPGQIEIATLSEVVAGTDSSRAVTPQGLRYFVGDIRKKAILDPEWIGPGPARVKFLPGNTLSSEAYQWIGEPKIYGNRVVNMIPQGATWAIEGHSYEEGYGGKVDLEPTLQNGWKSYNYNSGVAYDRWSQPKVQRLVSGIVILSGLVSGGTVTSGTTIATLPPGYRPDTDMMFMAENGGSHKAITVRADGRIQVEGGNWIVSYVSLDGIAFPAAGVATWTEIGASGSGSSFANSWKNFTNPIWGNARYWKDPYGIVWFAGLIYNGSTATDNTNMVVLPASHRAHLQEHVRTVANNTYGLVGAANTNGLNWKPNTSNQWISLAPVTLITEDALAMPWKDFKFLSGWSSNGTNFPVPAVLRREDGLAMSKGLIKGGTAPAIHVGILRGEVVPENELILVGASNATFARIDINSRNYSSDDQRGHFKFVTGTASWASLDGLMWMV